MIEIVNPNRWRIYTAPTLWIMLDWVAQNRHLRLLSTHFSKLRHGGDYGIFNDYGNWCSSEWPVSLNHSLWLRLALALIRPFFAYALLFDPFNWWICKCHPPCHSLRVFQPDCTWPTGGNLHVLSYQVASGGRLFQGSSNNLGWSLRNDPLIQIRNL